MGKKSKPPPAPDYTKLAEQTAASNAAAMEKQTAANRPDQTDVYGNVSKWTQDPTTGKWSQTQQLSQANQDYLNQQNAMRSGLMGQAADSLSKPIDMSQLQGYTNYDPSQLQGVDPNALQQGTGPMGELGAPGELGQLQGGYGDWGKLQENYGQMGNLQGGGQFGMDPMGNAQQIQDATYKLLSPQREMARNSEIQRLKNQGLTEDSPAFQRAVARLDTGDTEAQLRSLLAGQQEYGNQFSRAMGQNQQNFGQNLSAAQLANAQQAQLFGQDMSRAGLANQLRGQQSAEDLAQAQFGSQNQNQQFQQGLQGASYADLQNQQKFQQNLAQQNLAMQLRGQQFGEQGAQAQMNAGLRNQQLGEQSALRQQPLNDLQQLMQMQQYANPQFGSFMGAGNAGGVDYSGAGKQQQDAAMAAYNAQQAGSGGLMKGLFSLGGAVLGGPLGGIIGNKIGGMMGGDKPEQLVRLG